jgi:hypothetical protein
MAGWEAPHPRADPAPDRLPRAVAQCHEHDRVGAEPARRRLAKPILHTRAGPATERLTREGKVMNSTAENAE